MTSPRHVLPLHMGILGLAACVLLACGPAWAEDQARETLVVGFTAAHFVDINRADAIAAMKVWIETVINDRGFNLGAKTLVYDDAEDLSEALRSGTPDLMILLTPEYVSLRREGLLEPRYVSVRGPGMGETYVLVVDRAGGPKTLDDLRGRDLVMKVGARMCLAEDWLERLLADEGLPATGTLFNDVICEKNVSRAVLPVFFGKADACLITRNGFETMCELNPQIRRRLEPLALSPRLVPSVTCLRLDYESPYRADVIEALGELHKEPKGEQILSLFRVDRLVPFEPSHLESAVELLGPRQVAQLSGGRP